MLETNLAARAREVSDVTGAGDSVIATVAVALVGWRLPREAAELANHAAGVAVAKFGPVAVTRDELLEAALSPESAICDVGVQPAWPLRWTHRLHASDPGQNRASGCEPRTGSLLIASSIDSSSLSLNQCLKCRRPVNTMASPCSSAASITSASRTDPPGCTTAVAPAAATASRPSRNGKNASEAATVPAERAVRPS